MSDRVTVLGLGSIGLRHARNLLADGVAVTGFDPDPARRALLEADGGRAVEAREAAIAEGDAVVIASPTQCHRDDLDAVIAAGRHALVEKPLGHVADGLAALLARAHDQGLVIAAALNLRFLPAVMRAKTLIEEGALGEILWARLLCASYLPDWRPHQDHRKGYANDAEGGGVMRDIIHEFDLAHHLLGPARVIAAAARNSGTIGIATEDMADILLEHESGVRSALHLDYVTRPPIRVTEIAGTEGRLAIDIFANALELRGSDGTMREARRWETTMDEAYREEMRDFLKAIEERRPPRCDGREALGVLEQVMAARRMAELP